MDPMGQRPAPPPKSPKDQARLGAAVVLVVLLVIFVLQNTDKTDVDFIFTDVKMPLIFVLIGTAFVGAAASSLLQFVLRRRRDREQ